MVVVNASAGDPLAASALPALNPNQPNHSRPAPSSVNGTLWGTSAFERIVAAPADDDRGDERGHARVHVDDGAAGEIERAHLREKAAAPDPVRDRRVDDERPQGDERDVGGKPHALDDGARDERRRDDAERALIAHEQQVREWWPRVGSRPTPRRKTRDVSPIQSLPARRRASSR